MTLPLDDEALFDLMAPALDEMAAFDRERVITEKEMELRQTVDPAQWAWLQDAPPAKMGDENFRVYVQRYIDQLATAREVVGPEYRFPALHPANVYGNKIRDAFEVDTLPFPPQPLPMPHPQPLTATEAVLNSQWAQDNWHTHVLAQQRLAEAQLESTRRQQARQPALSSSGFWRNSILGGLGGNLKNR